MVLPENPQGGIESRSFLFFSSYRAMAAFWYILFFFSFSKLQWQV